MALQIVVDYKDQPVTYNVVNEDKNIFRLYLDGNATHLGDSYLPDKINIRRKGKIWISDLEDDNALVQALMKEITRFSNVSND
jgi:hypothetical protein